MSTTKRTNSPCDSPEPCRRVADRKTKTAGDIKEAA